MYSTFGYEVPKSHISFSHHPLSPARLNKERTAFAALAESFSQKGLQTVQSEL
jgi:hypothetical protein